MKKLLTMLFTATLTAITSATIVSCGTKEDDGDHSENNGLTVDELFSKYLDNAELIQKCENDLAETPEGEELINYMTLYIDNFDIELHLVESNKAIEITIDPDYIESFKLIDFDKNLDKWKEEKISNEIFSTLTMVFVWGKNLEGFEKPDDYPEIPGKLFKSVNTLSKTYEKLGFDFMELGKKAITGNNQ